MMAANRRTTFGDVLPFQQLVTTSTCGEALRPVLEENAEMENAVLELHDKYEARSDRSSYREAVHDDEVEFQSIPRYVPLGATTGLSRYAKSMTTAASRERLKAVDPPGKSTMASSRNLEILANHDWQREVEQLMQPDSTDIEEFDDEEAHDARLASAATTGDLNSAPPTIHRRVPSDIHDGPLFPSTALPQGVSIFFNEQCGRAYTWDDPYDISDFSVDKDPMMELLIPNRLDTISPTDFDILRDGDKGGTTDAVSRIHSERENDEQAADEPSIIAETEDKLPPQGLNAAEQKRLRIAATVLGSNSALAFHQSVSGKRLADNAPVRRGKRSLATALTHALVAKEHRNVTKPDLMETELKYFHRPRMTIKELDKKWIISLPQKPKDLKRSISKGFDLPGRAASSVVSTLDTRANDRQNLTLALGDFILIEYVEEIPPVNLLPGMASAIVNYYRSDEPVIGERDQEKRQKISNVMGHVPNSQLSSRLPTHMRLLLQVRCGVHPRIVTSGSTTSLIYHSSSHTIPLTVF
jgi:Protein of unknown function (DUF3591)